MLLCSHLQVASSSFLVIHIVFDAWTSISITLFYALELLHLIERKTGRVWCTKVSQEYALRCSYNTNLPFCGAKGTMTIGVYKVVKNLNQNDHLEPNSVDQQWVFLRSISERLQILPSAKVIKCILIAKPVFICPIAMLF